MEKPKTVEEYIKWLYDNKIADCCRRSETYYKSVISSAHDQFIDGKFWKKVINEWNNINTKYYSETGYNLFAEKLAEVLIKPYSSIIDKTFRKNIIYNTDWPKPPAKQGKWIIPNDCFEYLNDCLRTSIIVKYLDGAEYILKILISYAESEHLEYRFDYEAKDQGYYAIHFYVYDIYEVPDEKWDTKKIIIQTEIQITTQIQETIRKLTHEYYETRRSTMVEENVKWQWNYKSNEFIVNYMGHLLHYLEGMIMEIRDKGSIKE